MAGDQFDEIGILADEYRVGSTCSAKYFRVFGIPKSEIAQSNRLHPHDWVNQAASPGGS